MDLPKRKRNRLESFDYSACGAYFVTVCTRDVSLWSIGAELIRPKEPPLSQYKRIVDMAINEICKHYTNVMVDQYCIMPEHVHMILVMMPLESEREAVGEEPGRMISAPTLSGVVGSMKRWVSKQIGFSIWQKSFNDKIIRNEQGYHEICKYIEENPMNWIASQMQGV